jgi:hypothetical protein
LAILLEQPLNFSLIGNRWVEEEGLLGIQRLAIWKFETQHKSPPFNSGMPIRLSSKFVASIAKHRAINHPLSLRLSKACDEVIID